MRKFWKSRASAPAEETTETNTDRKATNVSDSDMSHTLRAGDVGLHARDPHADRRIANDAAALGMSIARRSRAEIDAAALGTPRESLLTRAFRIR